MKKLLLLCFARNDLQELVFEYPLLYMLATDDMALSYSQQLDILLSINHALIHLDGGIKSG